MLFLGAAQILSIVGVVSMLMLKVEVPDAFWALATNPGVALGAILSSTRGEANHDHPAPVQIMNQKKDAVPTVDQSEA